MIYSSIAFIANTIHALQTKVLLLVESDASEMKIIAIYFDIHIELQIRESIDNNSKINF